MPRKHHTFIYSILTLSLLASTQVHAGMDDVRQGVHELNCIMNPKDCEQATEASKAQVANPGSKSSATTSTSSAPGKHANVSLTQLAVTGATASTQAAQFKSKFAIDGTENKRWCSKGKHIDGQSLKLDFEGEKTLYKVKLSVPQLKHNLMIKEVTFSFSNGSTQAYSLNTGWGEQTIDINPVKSAYLNIGFSQVEARKNVKKPRICVAEASVFGTE